MCANYTDNHNSKNPAIRYLMKNFYNSFINEIKKENITNMIDMGCGEGHLTNVLYSFFKKNKKDIKITGIEYCPETVSFARKKYPHLNIKQGDILNFKGKYDLLISSEVLEHIKDYQEAIINCKKISSTCIFSVPHEPWFRIANMLRFKYLKRWGSTPGHINHWSKKKFYFLLKKHFKDVKIKTTGFWLVAKCKNP